MADAIEHLILEQFCAMRNQVASLQSEMSSEFADVKYRINRLESAVAGVHALPCNRPPKRPHRVVLIRHLHVRGDQLDV